MEYTEAMRYVMEGAKQQIENKVPSTENNLTAEEMKAFERDYAELDQLAADVEVLKGKLKDFKDADSKNKADFEALVKKLAALQIEKDELEGMGWKKIKNVITGQYGKKIDSIESDQMVAQVEMNAVKMNMQMTADKIKETEKSLRQARKAFNIKRKFMKETYGENNRYEMEIEHKNVRIRSVIKEIDEACDAIFRVMDIGNTAYQYADSMVNMGTAADVVSYAGGFIGMAASMAVGSIADNRYEQMQENIMAVSAMMPIVWKEIKDVLDSYLVFANEYTEKDDSPYEDLNDESDLDHPIAFVRANFYAINGRSVYNMDDLSTMFGRLQVIKKNLVKQRTLLSKELKK